MSQFVKISFIAIKSVDKKYNFLIYFAEYSKIVELFWARTWEILRSRLNI